LKRAIKNDQDLKKRYESAKAIIKPTRAEAQQRGYEFEAIIEYLLRDFEVQLSYRVPGEQIDGSFFHWGQTFLVEAKWQRPKIEASEIYAFKGKLDGKFHTTSGVFFSMSGYSDDTTDALRFGKEINILLFDGSDIDAIIEDDVPFIDILKYKLRQAGNTGNPNVPYSLKKDAAEVSSQQPVIAGHKDNGIDIGQPGDPMFLVLTDRMAGEYISEILFKELRLERPVAFQFKQIKISAHSTQIINTTVSQVVFGALRHDFRGVILLLNDDTEGDEIKQRLEKPLRELLGSNAIPVELAVFNIDFSSLRQQAFQSVKFIRRIGGVRSLIDYLNSATIDAHFFYDDLAARKAVRTALENADWNEQSKTVTFPDDYDQRASKTIIKYDQLLAYLEELALQAAGEETPNDILKDDEQRPDYSDLVYRLLEGYTHELRSIRFIK